ncbi:hypothetical protein CCR75_002911 [Bremia lactucae]|uniref:Uncharacterized protein n=1 Tax=Bremia lactucae TaxID=4779 RepID=A0A976FPP0_BRELC|nr:hypothetical protein CCR75_002911 [Bremia lactucae]
MVPLETFKVLEVPEVVVVIVTLPATNLRRIKHLGYTFSHFFILKLYPSFGILYSTIATPGYALLMQ